MATNYIFQCPACKKEHWPGGLFEVFERWVRERGPWSCPDCNEPYEFRLTFPFAFGADGSIRVIDIFAPHTSCEWTPDSGHHISFHPFLVVGETLRDPPERTAWLPYWHVDAHEGRRKLKYGQWAPHMDLKLFAELVDQAREKEHLL